MVDRRRFLKTAGWMAAAGWIPSRLLAHDMHGMQAAPAGKVGNDLCMHPMGDTTHMPGLVDPGKLAPFVEAALARKQWMQPLADDEIPVVRASVAKAQTAGRLA